MKVAVTGATGFLGTNLMNSVLPYGRPLQVSEINDLNALHRSFSRGKVDAVIHLAAQTEVQLSISEPTHAFHVNVMGTANVLEACRLASVPRVIVASSDKAYGPLNEPYVETMPLNGRAPYDCSKACADMIAQSYIKTYGMSIAITRCGNIYGPEQKNMTTLIPYVISCFKKGQRPVLRSDGTMVRDWMYVSDAVSAYQSLLNSKEVGAFNFSGGNPTTVLEVIGMIGELMGSDIKPDIQATSKGEIQSQTLDCSKAKRVLGWEPKVSLRDGLKKTIEYWELQS